MAYVSGYYVHDAGENIININCENMKTHVDTDTEEAAIYSGVYDTVAKRCMPVSIFAASSSGSDSSDTLCGDKESVVSGDDNTHSGSEADSESKNPRDTHSDTDTDTDTHTHTHTSDTHTHTHTSDNSSSHTCHEKFVESQAEEISQSESSHEGTEPSDAITLYSTDFADSTKSTHSSTDAELGLPSSRTKMKGRKLFPEFIERRGKSMMEELISRHERIGEELDHLREERRHTHKHTHTHTHKRESA
eukprot:GHVR01132093.1.p1 GENE.GHVR01132093.1~~GHVR01132093.1.p1  ORF type:complete len:255 (+),score=136.07 GHVR01132093.1:22-765(+)